MVILQSIGEDQLFVYELYSSECSVTGTTPEFNSGQKSVLSLLLVTCVSSPLLLSRDVCASKVSLL